MKNHKLSGFVYPEMQLVCSAVKNFISTAGLLVALLMASPLAKASTLNLTPYVNPFLGTSPATNYGFTFDTGDVFPGATQPEGMVQFSPDTTSGIPGGYWYPDTQIKSFSLTHFSGRGVAYEEDFGFFPVPGAMVASNNFSFGSYTKSFSHSNETASPGYYKVVLSNNQTVELTVTPHTGVMQATFPSGTSVGTILLNMANNVNGLSAGQVNIVNGNELTGYATSTTSGGQAYTIYISVVFDQTITASGTWSGSTLTPGSNSSSGTNLGAYVSFNTSSNEVVHATAGISYVSIANAQLNRTTEYPQGSTFSSVQAAASNAWNTRLNRIQITDANASTNSLTVFYTELYHTMIHPDIFDDVNGQYIGFDSKIYTLAAGHHHYTHIPGWDTYRSHSAFKAFLLPTLYSDVAQSLVDDANQSVNLPSGYVGIPRWVQQNSDSKGMIGDGGTIILANAYAFGATGFDTTSAMTDMNANASGANGFREYESQFLSPGWIYDVNGVAAASLTLEYSVADMAVAQYAKSLGYAGYYHTYLNSAQNWKNVFNTNTKLIAGRYANGTWDPATASPNDDITPWREGSQGQYTWMVPFNLGALVSDMGGNSTVVSNLDTFFGWNSTTQMYTALNQGINSQNDYAGNEPSESAPWTYLYAGAPWKTQKVVRDIQTTCFSNVPAGLPGNDDAGAISSWYVTSALGIYPLISGVGGFVVGSPMFASATITTDSGHVLQINGTNAALANPYVQSLQVNGTSSTSLWLPVSTILNNTTTTLNFTLGSTPNTSWGTGPADVPPSFDVPTTTPTIATAPSANPSPVTGTTTTLSVLGADTSSAGESGLTYTWSTTSSPSGANAPAFGSTNGTNGGKNTVVTFYSSGNYSFKVLIANASANTVTGTVSVTVNQVSAGLSITPSVANILPGATQQFAANVTDQFGNTISSPTLVWSVLSGTASGSINVNTGLYQATSIVGASTIQAVGGSYTATATVNVAPVLDVTNGLVGRWNFEELSGTTANDTSPNSSPNTGTLTNGPTWVTPGKVGNGCLKFTPTALEYVQIPDATSLDPTTAITLSGWANAIAWNGNNRIMEKGDPTGLNSGDNQYRLLVENPSGNGTMLKFELYLNNTATNITAALPTTGAWHLIAGTWDGTTMKLYVDNVVVASAPASGTIATTMGPLIIGGKNTVSTNTVNIFNGSLDDVRVYNRALSTSEMTSLYNAATSLPWIASATAATPSTVLAGSTASLSVLGGDVNGESILKYNWQTTGTPPGPVTFSANNTNAAKQTVASFTQPGTYNLSVTVTDPQGQTATSTLTVPVTTTLNATYTAANTVPLTVSSFNATGLTLSLNLSYAPSPGDVLLVVNNTGSSPITGTFSNLPNNGTITATYNGTTYNFTANYAGGSSGNDLILTYVPANGPPTDTPTVPPIGLALLGLLLLASAYRFRPQSQTQE